jgi:hypothetical protein
MDPVTLALAAALAALGSGMAKSAGAVGENVVRDAYTGLKHLLRTKFGSDSRVAKAVDDLEAEPDSEGYKVVLREQVAKAQADHDPDVLQAAQALLDRLGAQPGGAQFIQHVVGNYNAVAGHGGHAEVRVNQPSDGAPRP